MKAEDFLGRVNAKLVRGRNKPLTGAAEAAIREVYKRLQLYMVPPALQEQRRKVCAACGAAAQGNFSVHRDGWDAGPVVPLCNDCGMENGPSLGTIWELIRARAEYTRERFKAIHSEIDSQKKEGA